MRKTAAEEARERYEEYLKAEAGPAFGIIVNAVINNADSGIVISNFEKKDLPDWEKAENEQDFISKLKTALSIEGINLSLVDKSRLVATWR